VLLAAGCITSPTNKARVDDYTQPVSLQGYVFTPSASIHVEALNQSTGQWETVGPTTTSSATPDLPAGAFAQNPDMYAWRLRTAVGSSSDTSTFCRFSPTCERPGTHAGVYTAKVRGVQDGSLLGTFEDDGLACLTTLAGKGVPFLSAAVSCESPESPIVRLRDIYEFTPAVGIDGASFPAIGSGSYGSVLVAAVSPFGELQVRESVRPEVWAVATVGLGPTGGFARETSPILLRSNQDVHLVARGADNNLYSSHRTGSGPFGPFQALTSDGSVRGRVSAAVTGSGSVLHAVYPSGGGNVSYRRFQNAVQIGAQTLAGFDDATVGSNDDAHIVVVARGYYRMDALRATAGSGWTFETMAHLARDVLDISNVAFMGGAFHVTYAQRTLTDDVSNSYSYDVYHLSIPLTQRGATYLTVGKYRPLASGGAFVALSEYRRKLVTAWTDADRGVHVARWDNLDPTLPWISEGSIGKASALGRPVMAPSNTRVRLYREEFSMSRYGDDLFVAGLDGGHVVFANLSRSVMRRDIDASFKLYDNESFASCFAQNDPNAPHPIPDLWADDRPLVTELGYNLWMLPNWFVGRLYPGVAADHCNRGGGSGRLDPPCSSQKFPIIFKPDGGLTYCNDSSAWVNRDSIAMAIWDELGHASTEPLGINDESTGPTDVHATRSGIPLTELRTAHAMFNELVGTCVGPDRCPGFTQQYASTSREHSFLYTVAWYITDPEALRSFIREDLAGGSTLLSRKYEWVKRNIFRGIELGAN
jgi:hypothetical protein